MNPTDIKSGDKGPFEAVVRANEQIGEMFHRLTLDFDGTAAEAFAKTSPGQFAQFDLSRTAVPKQAELPEELADMPDRNILLRRPFSFCDIDTKDGKTTAKVLYEVVGPATLRMTTLARNDTLSIIGPLGKGFEVPEGKKCVLLVCGGMGAAPLLHMAKYLTSDYSELEVIAFAGAKTRKKLPFDKCLDKLSEGLGFALNEFARYGINSTVTTDDGSAGKKGFVTDCVLQWLEENRTSKKEIVIYGCGPEAMLAKVADIANDEDIDCQLSMERRMGCGIGLCQSCAVECKTQGSAETTYKLCCEDGPVFDGRQVVFNV